MYSLSTPQADSAYITAVIWSCKEKLKVLFHPMVPDFWKSTAFGRFFRDLSRLSFWQEQHVHELLWNIGEMTLTGNKRNTPRKSCPSVTLSTINLKWAYVQSSPGFRYRDRQSTACAMACPVCAMLYYMHLKIQSLPRRKHTVSVIQNESVSTVWVKAIPLQA